MREAHVHVFALNIRSSVSADVKGRDIHDTLLSTGIA